MSSGRRVQFPISLKSGGKEIVIGSDRTVSIGKPKKASTNTTKQTKPQRSNTNSSVPNKSAKVLKTSQPVKNSKPKLANQDKSGRPRPKPDDAIKSRINSSKSESKTAIKPAKTIKNEHITTAGDVGLSTAPLQTYDHATNQELLESTIPEKKISEPTSAPNIVERLEEPQSNLLNDDDLLKSIKMHTHEQSSSNRIVVEQRLNEKWKQDLAKQVQERKKMKDAIKNRKDDVEEYYNPWGRPGCGAPIVDDNRQIVHDYRRRKLNESLEMPTQTDSLPRQENTLNTESRLSIHMDQNKTSLSPTTNFNDNLPPAMRSSMIIGEVAPSNWVDQVKEQEKRRWLADLEQQIQSKQQRKKTSKFSSEAQEPSNLLIQNQQQISPVANKEEDENKSYLRGRGLALDSQTQKELEAKRNREMQNQLYNKQQMEEKQRRKQQEQDKLLREENLEIQRLESNTSTVDQAVPDDQQEMPISELKQKRKGNNNVDNTYQKILEAQEAAKLAKKEKLMKKLKKHGHDVSNLYGREGGHAREKPMESRYNKPMVPVLERVEIPEPTNDPAVMQNASDPDDIQLQSPRRKKEGLLLDSSSHAIPVPIEQLAEEEEERLKEEEITPQQSQYDHFRDYGSREDTGEEYTSPQAIARTSNKIRKSVDNDIREKGKGNKSDSRSHDKNEAKGSHNYSKITKSRAVKTQDKVNATARRNGLQNDKNKTHKSIQSKTNKPNGDKRERTERNNKPSIRLINNPKSDPSPTVEYDRDPAEEMYTPEPELKSQRNYVVQNHRGMKELKSRSEIAPIMTTSPIPSNEVLAMRLVNYELEAEVRKLKEQIQDLGRQVMIKRDPTPSPSKPIVSIPTVSNDLPQDEILDQLATLRKGLLLRRNELERAYTPYSAQIMNDSEYT